METLDLLFEEIEALLDEENFEAVQDLIKELNISTMKELVDEFPEYGAKFIDLLPVNRSVHVFGLLDFPVQERIIKQLPGLKISEIINGMPPDNRTAFLGDLHADAVKQLIILLPPEERQEALGLLGYEEDTIGRLMTPDYIAINPDWDVAKVIQHIRKHGINSETIDVIYVINDDGILVDDLQIRKILLADPKTKISELMDNRLVALKAEAPQEEAIEVFRLNNRVALPVTNNEQILLGIVTIDDVLRVAQEEYAEDLQKMGGMDNLDEPYLEAPLFKLIRKRAPWLIILFLGELLTASAMTYFEVEIEKATVLAMFIPLVVSSGGNSGSQASTLIIQAMAVGDITLKDWWRVMKREVISGLILGLIIGLIGFGRVSIWEWLYNMGLLNYSNGVEWLSISFTVGVSLIGIILWGSLTGSMLPIILKRLGADPAASSAPFVATLVDVTGIIIYFSVAFLFLHNTLLA